MTSNLMTVADVAKELGYSKRTIHRWLREGILTGERHPRDWRIPASAVKEFREARSNVAPVRGQAS